MTVCAVTACWLWAALNEKAMPSSDRAKRLMANRTKIMARITLFDVIGRYKDRKGSRRSVTDVTF
jgi:hypothetical protein